MAMAILPEEFPVVLTIFLALGAWRISHKHVLTRRVPTVETLGAATVLCVDKTGTLTQNRMSVGKLLVNGDFWTVNENSEQPLPENFHELFEVGILASRPDPFDPMEKALKELGRRYLKETEHLHDDWLLMQEYPLTQELLSFAQVWQSADHLDYLVAAKGAPRLSPTCAISARWKFTSLISRFIPWQVRGYGYLVWPKLPPVPQLFLVNSMIFPLSSLD